MGLFIDRIRAAIHVVRPAIVPLRYGSYTITGTAGTFLSFADSGSPDTTPPGAKSFRGVLETAPIRVRFGETAPTATEGELVSVDSVVVLDVGEFNVLTSFIRTTGASGVIKGHFYPVESSVLLGGL